MALGVENYPFLIDRENYLRLNLFFFVSKWEIGNRLGGDKVSIFDRVSEDSRKVVCTATVLLFHHLVRPAHQVSINTRKY